MDKLNRFDWDSTFMSLCFNLAIARSIDPDTKHASIAVDEEKSFLCAGYNGPVRGINDEEVPLTRPEKYDYIEHSERNLIDNAARNGICLKNSTVYITGAPCKDCIRSLIQVKVSRIVYGPLKSACITQGDQKAIDLMLTYAPVEMVSYNDMKHVDDLLNKIKYYLNEKGFLK